MIKRKKRNSLSPRSSDNEDRSEQELQIKHVDHNREAIQYILILFVISRLVLTFIGGWSHLYLENVIGMPHRGLEFSPSVWLDAWGVWDTGWYVDIAENWYSADVNDSGQSNIAFFPLYPLLMRIVGFLLGDYFIGGLVVSNLAFLAGTWLLYRLVAQEFNHQMGCRAVLFMFLFPTAFIFSGVFTESLFIACSIASFWFARTNRWLLAGIFGGFTALTKLLGILICIPLFLEYMKMCDFNPRRIRANVLFIAIVPLGVAIFMLQCYLLTGDFLAFYHIQKSGWFQNPSNPISVIWRLINSDRVDFAFNALFAIVVFLILIARFRKISPSFLLWSMFLMLIPLSSAGVPSCLSRYCLVVFPIYIILARMFPQDKAWHQAAVIFMTLLQGFLMVFWSNGFTVVI